ncbi:MAG: MtrB/PioB family outer membrane beta-barrel protein [Ignavibacteriales bacterium]|nr:MtrB/PioB family outer membrane beta-barrel protein [Ignavibacteriales bacterium]
MKKVRCYAAAIFLGSIAFQALAQDQPKISGEYTPGVRWIDLKTNSSKFNEYRDLRDGFSMQGLRFDVLEDETGWFLDFSGKTLLRDDQKIFLRLGHSSSRWNLTVDHNESPHRLSNKAMTPYIERGDGLFTLPAHVSILKDGNDATGTPSLVPTTGQMAVNDSLIATYLETYLRPVHQGTRRDRTTATLDVPHVGSFDFRLSYLHERRNGSRSTYGPIGDRPPRTLNIQVPEPVDYVTREVRANAEYAGNGFQAQLNYIFSTFNNRVEVMRWENIYFAPDAGADFITTVPGTARNVSDFGQRSLAPDNFSHNFSVIAGFDLPLESRLTSTAVFGVMRQNEQLLPYSFSTLGGDLPGDGLNWNDPGKLPRARAEAEMQTMRLDLEYTINPVNQLNLRPYVHYYKLDNRTPIARWRYVTQDVAGTNGDVGYRNLRRNVAYAYDNLKVGLDVRHYLSFWRTTLGAGYAREKINREFREADTGENIFEASVRSRPTRSLSLTAGFLFGDRKSEGYDFSVTSQSYWYEASQVNRNPGPPIPDVDDPRFLFANHPDLRKFDVSDRKRNELKLSATYIAREDLDVTALYRYRRDDFDSHVVPLAPLTGQANLLHPLADADAVTPGRQLGLLLDRRQNISANVHYVPTEQWTITVFADREFTVSDLRGMVFNENQRWYPNNPAIQSSTALGPWTDPDRIYNARTEEATNTLGFGLAYEILAGKLRLLTDVSLSRSTVDLDYTGYGSDPAYLGRDWETFQFGFNNPGKARFNQTVISASVEYTLLQNLILGFHYFFNRYSIQDWVQEPAGPWVEQVGSEFLLRDTSRDNRWGNRLVSMGSYLAPGYEAHVGFATVTFRF